MKSKDKHKYKSIFMSDIHLGSKHSNVDRLLKFLKSSEAENYLLIGDIIDGWLLRKRFHWPESHNNFVQFFLKQAKEKNDKIVTYIIGNHDSFLLPFENQWIGGIHLAREGYHIAADGKKYLMIHGDQFDMVTTTYPLLGHIGGWLYDTMISLNKPVSRMFQFFGIDFSLSRWSKSAVKEAVQFIGNYEKVLVEYARKQGCDGVICGHIHHAENKMMEDIHYLNTGDMVESCTVIVEHLDGEFEILELKD